MKFLSPWRGNCRIGCASRIRFPLPFRSILFVDTRKYPTDAILVPVCAKFYVVYGIRWKSHFHPINTIPFDLNRWNVSIRLKVFLNSIPIDGMLSCSVQNLSFGKERKGLLSSMLYNIRWKNYFYPIKTISRPKFDSFRWDTSLFCAKFEVWKRKKRILYSIVYSLEIASIRFQSTLLETISRSR